MFLFGLDIHNWIIDQLINISVWSNVLLHFYFECLTLNTYNWTMFNCHFQILNSLVFKLIWRATFFWEWHLINNYLYCKINLKNWNTLRCMLINKKMITIKSFLKQLKTRVLFLKLQTSEDILGAMRVNQPILGNKTK